MARRQLEVSNEVAAELAGSRDAALRTLEEQLDCEVFLRGNVITLDGEAEAVQAGATVIRELSAMVERGHDIGPATVEAVARVLESSESPSRVLEDVVWRHRNLRVAPKSVRHHVAPASAHGCGSSPGSTLTTTSATSRPSR